MRKLKAVAAVAVYAALSSGVAFASEDAMIAQLARYGVRFMGVETPPVFITLPIEEVILAALRFAAAVLGWRVQWLPEWGDAQLAKLLGLDRTDDFADAEHETPELLVRVTLPARQRRWRVSLSHPRPSAGRSAREPGCPPRPSAVRPRA